MLTDTQIRKAKPQDKPYKLADGRGLHVYVTPAGAKVFRYRYEIGGREKQLAIGPYPEVSLAQAREHRDVARQLLREGKDPSQEKRKGALGIDQGHTFEAIARDWHGRQKLRWADNHAADVISSLETFVFPEIGSRGMRSITVPDVLELLRKIEARPAVETARRVRQRISAVFVYAISSGLADHDPAAVVQKALAPLVRGRQPAITDLAGAREMLARAASIPAHPATKLALRLLMLTAVRPGTLAKTPWEELRGLDRVKPVWVIPAARMKLLKQHKDDDTRDHMVPLARQAVEVIEALEPLTGRQPYVFPNVRHAHKPMSENALGYLLNRAGYHGQHVPHGCRATFSTIMNEMFPADRAVIDLMLAHVAKDKVEGAYNRAAYIARRQELAQAWADLILEGAPPANELVVGLRR